jgi:hypothetical protein
MFTHFQFIPADDGGNLVGPHMEGSENEIVLSTKAKGKK